MNELEALKATTYTNVNEGGVLTLENIQKAIKSIKDNSLAPYPVKILQSEELVQRIFPKSIEPSFVSFYHGISVYEDETVPKGKLRFVMSDGTEKDFTV